MSRDFRHDNDEDNDDDVYPNKKDSRRIRVKKAKPRNEIAKRMIEEGMGKTRAFKQRKKAADKYLCRGKIDPDDYLDEMDDGYDPLGYKDCFGEE